MANPELVEDGEELVIDLLVPSTLKYVDSGVGTTPPVKGDTGLESACGEARDAGAQSEGATASIYKVVATHTYAGSFAITEFGQFDSVSGGVLFIRGTFAAINVANGDKIEFTSNFEMQ